MVFPSKIYLAGNWKSTSEQLDVIFPYDNSVVSSVCLASSSDINLAIEAARSSFLETKKLATFDKKNIIQDVIDRLQERKESFVEAIILEAGKPRKYALSEFERAVQTLRIAKEECGRGYGDVIPLDWTDKGLGKRGITKHVPKGVVSAITPFNFPLNLVMHKVAPALASGCPIVLKPASKTPISSLLLAEVISETQWPKAAFSVLPCTRNVGDQLVTDNRIDLLSFTGSPSVGWSMKSRAGKKSVVLELGGNAASIIDRETDLARILPQLLIGCFAYSGQVCIHTQRIYVHASLKSQLIELFIQEISDWKNASPKEFECVMSSMISEKEAIRVENWVNEALDEGAQVLIGGKRLGNYYEPTVLTNTNSSMKVVAEELFGPVVIIESFERIEEAIQAVNDSKFGLQASIFSNNHKHINQSFDELDVGALIVNDATTFRVDHMPYGGVKDSGLGREGVKYAIKDMTEVKMMVD